MSDAANPFAKPVTKAKTSRAARVFVWVLAVVSVALGIGLLAVWDTSRQFRQQLDSLQSAWTTATNDLATTGTQLAFLQHTNAALQAQLAELAQEKAQTVQSARSLEDQLRAELESKDVTISQLQGKLTVNILDRILFDSGEAILKPDGEAVLQKVASILTQHPEIKVHVIGHTDNVPIRVTARSRFPSNWELSTERALAAVRFLTERAGVPPQRLGAVGYGEFRPVADNATVEGRARNRRIAITILPDELVGADTVPTTTIAPSSGSPTNLPAME
jgi:chemotaxis protein MotB